MSGSPRDCGDVQGPPGLKLVGTPEEIALAPREEPQHCGIGIEIDFRAVRAAEQEQLFGIASASGRAFGSRPWQEQEVRRQKDAELEEQGQKLEEQGQAHEEALAELARLRAQLGAPSEGVP